MAANAKEYKDLQQAASIADDALVATAEPNATELQTSTVTALAQKIQEINTDGPLAELELATSIGKQQLAEALTEKGVPTTANETEIQMADKVRSLQTVSGTSILVSTFLDDSSISSASTSYPYPFAYIRLLNDDLVALAGSALYYIDHTLEYANIAGMIAQATSSAECPITLGTAGELRYSANTEYVAIPLTTTSVAVYHVDMSAKSVTLVKTVTLPKEINRYSNSGTMQVVGITNNGRYYFYVDSGKQFTAYDITTEKVLAQTPAESSYAFYSGTVSAVIIESETGGTLCFNANGNGSTYAHQYNIDYTTTADGLEFGSVLYLPYKPMYCPPQFLGYGLSYSYVEWYPGATGNASLVKAYTITVYNVKTQASCGNITIPIVQRKVTLSINPDNFGPLNDIVPKKNQDGTWRLTIPGDVLDLTFNPEKGTLKYTDASYTTMVQATCTYATNAPSYSDGIRRTVLETPGGYVIGLSYDSITNITATDASWVPVHSGLYQYHAKAYKKQFSGMLHTMNGHTTIYLAPQVTSESIAEGAYDLKTSAVPLPESDAQESN